MKLLAIAALAAVLLAGGAQAASPAAATSTVTVTGTGTVTAVPDQASFAFTVQTKATTASAVLSRNATLTRAVISAVEDAGVPEANIQTSQVSLDPVTSNDGTSIVAFTASDTIMVTKLAIAKTGAVVDAAVGAGATSVSGPSLAISSQDAIYAKALKAAVAQAKTKAQALADASGLTLGGVVTMVEGGGASPLPFAQGAAKDTTPIEPGTQDVRASVTVTFSLS
jgi:uncharacterized protein